MTLATEIDLGPLTWVKGEIDAALAKAREQLTLFAGNPLDSAPLRFSTTHLHQVTGALQMVGLDGLARFAEELERLLAALEKREAPADGDHLDLADRGLTRIARYLDDLMLGEPDQPLVLFPLYREIVQAAGRERVTESELFYPDLGVRPPRGEESPVGLAELPAFVREQRRRYQKGLLAWLRNPQDTAGLTQMREALAAIEATQPQPANRVFWWNAVAYCEALQDGGLPAEFATKTLCARIDQQIRRLSERSGKVAERLLRDMLYHIGRAQPATPRLEEVQAAYRLPDRLAIPAAQPPQDTTQVAEYERLRPLLRELSEALGLAKDAWLKFTAGNRDALKTFQTQAGKLASRAVALNQPALEALLASIAAAGDQVRPEAAADETLAMEMATALLLAENALENFAQISPSFAGQAHVQSKRLAAAVAGESLEGLESVSLLDDMARRAQEKLVLAQVGAEIQNNLRHVEDVLDGYFRDSTRRGELPALKPALAQIAGALRILELERAAELLSACEGLIEKFANPATNPTAEELELVAEGLSSLGFYVEAVQNGRKDAFEILAPVLRRFPGLVLREVDAAATAEREEIEAAPASSVEAGLDEQKRRVREAYAAWREEALDARRDGLLAELSQLAQDAELIDDEALKTQAQAVLDLLPDGPSDELDAAVSRLTAPRVATVSPSAETARLLDASDEAIDREMLEVYLEEAQEVLATVRAHLALVAADPHDVAALATIRRGFHTLKGSGRMVGLTDLGEVAWGIEQTMNKWLQEERAATPELIQLLEAAHEAFSRWVRELDTHGHVEVDAAHLLAEAENLRGELKRAQARVDDARALPEPTEELSAPASQPTSPESAATETAAPAGSAIEAPAIEAIVETLPWPTASSPESAHVEPAKSAQPLPHPGPGAPPGASSEEGPTTWPGKQEISETLYEVYRKEASQHLATLEGGLAALQARPPAQVNHDFMRAAHTLAGISSTVGLDAPAELASALERLLVDLLAAGRPATAEETDLIAQAVAGLRAMLTAVFEGRAPASLPECVAALEAYVGARQPEAETESAAEPAVAALGEETEAAPWPPVSEPADEPAPPPVSDEASGSQAPAPEPDQTSPVRTFVPAEPAGLHDDLDAELLPIFLEEGQELMRLIGEELRQWRRQPESRAPAQAMQRALHTLKGSARMAGAMRLGGLTHQMEACVLAALEQGRQDLALFDELEGYFDRIGDLFDALLRGERAEPPAPLATASTETPAPSAAPGPGVLERPAQTAPAPRIENELSSLTPSDAASRAVLRVSAHVVDRLVNEAGEVAIARSRIEGEMRAFKQSLKELTDNVIRLRAQLREVEIQAETQMASRLSLAHDPHAEFDPLEFDRFTRLQELTRMMAESVNDVSTVQQALLKNIDETEAALVAQARMTRELQQQLMRMRMVPLSSITERLHRIVRQTARELGKRAALEIEGEGVELDRSVLEKMTAPFEHLLRNAIAHGLESEEERRLAGKAETGLIRVAARQESNEVVLTVADDGRGIDLARVRAKALALGLTGEDEEVSPERLTELIFRPGFSTAEEITQIAGRGVGMDVVRNEIAALGGRIEVATEPGRGTTFTIYLPLTLAVAQVVLVHAGSQLFAIPSSLVEQVQDLKREPLAEAYRKGAVVWLDNSYPLHYLPRLLGDDETQPEARTYTSVVLLKSGSQRIALHVDQLEGNREVVVKNIGPQLARVTGLSGATVLGDGRIVLIVNPVQLAHRETPHVAAAVRPPARAERPAAPLVMVVDDSLTVRKITGRLLAKEGYQVITAKDGVDALQQLQGQLPAVMLVDIEMPRMDGFELTKNVRGDPRTRHVPIIMITSRTAEKHRNYAKELGVDVYLGKPYQEEELLAHIERLCLETAPRVVAA